MTVKYPMMRLKEILKYEPFIEQENVSEIARSPTGFLGQYKRYKYANIMRKQKVPGENITWYQKRNSFIDRTLSAYQKKPTYRRWLSLVAWGYKTDILF